MYNEIYKFIPESVLNLNYEGKIIEVSYKTLEILEYDSIDKLTGKRFIDLFHDNDKDTIQKLMKNVQENNGIVSDSFKVLKSNGKPINLELTIGILQEPKNVAKMIVILHDINIYHKQLAHSRYLLDYVINHNKSGVAIHDVNMNYLYVSKKYIEQYNLKDENIIGKNHYDVFPDLPDKWKEVHKRALMGEIFSEDRDPFIREDKTIDWTRWECRPWYNYDNSIGGIIIYTEVINEQIETEEQLKEQLNIIQKQKNQIETVLNSIDEAVIHTDNKGIILYSNEEAANLLSYSNDELLGKSYPSVVNVYNDDTKEKLVTSVEMVLKTQKKYEMLRSVLLVNRNNKEYNVECIASPLKDINGNLYGVISLFKNITDYIQKVKEIGYYLNHDAMTGVYNFRYLNESMVKVDKEQCYPIGLFAMDINGLKIVNDAYGYLVGDNVIRDVVKILREICGDKYLLARIGGDEFSILLTNTSTLQLENIKNQIQEQVSKLKIENIEISLSIGYALRDNDSQDLTAYLSEVETNMYKNKIVYGKSIRNNAIKAILETLTQKYNYERIHSERVSYYCRKMGEQLKLSTDEISELEIAGMYHDIGKISILDSILGKPGKLTAEEFEIMKSHTTVGFQILKAADVYSNLAEYALSHHEKWDGTGYPNGLKGEEIPFFSRIINIADAYEAMTSDRVYRKKMTKTEAALEIIKWSGKQFDKTLANIFVTKVLNLKIDDL